MLQHKHAIIRAEIDNAPFDTTQVEQWLRELVANLGMQVLYGPKAMYCELEHNEGMSAFVILSTSHAVLHTWDRCEKPVLQLDIYTCSDFNLEIAWKAIEVFKPTKVEYKFLDREHGLTEISS